MELNELLRFWAEAVRYIDSSGIPFKQFHAGVGPYGEPQLLKAIIEFLKSNYPDHFAYGVTKAKPDILIPGEWAIEAKIVRPYGDNDKEAEHWSQNLLHPYRGNTSLIGDVYKLSELENSERKAIIAIGYEHFPPKIDIDVLVECFEHICHEVLGLSLGERQHEILEGLVHPVHQRAKLYAWQIY